MVIDVVVVVNVISSQFIIIIRQLQVQCEPTGNGTSVEGAIEYSLLPLN